MDVEVFVVFEFKVDGFCNYFSKNVCVFFIDVLVEWVNLLILIVLEMIVLIGGM